MVTNFKYLVIFKILVRHHFFYFKFNLLIEEFSADENRNLVLKYCKNPCNGTLKCNHKCSGTCGECYQGRIHKPCQEKCNAILPCGHECTAPCKEACRPCQKKCSYKCRHSKCTKKCGEPCTSCKEKCSRKCPHLKCTKLCGEICNVPPCIEPCEKLLKCKHPCIGFCGDICPQLCRICDAEVVTEIYLGFEDEEDSRFVYLKECGHIVESRGMEQWLSTELEGETREIKAAYCPRCKTTITSTLRYSDHIKRTCADLTLIKNKFHGDANEIAKLRINLLEKIVAIDEEYTRVISKGNVHSLQVKNRFLKKSVQEIMI